MIRTTENIDLYLIRHAEAYKNLEKVHGGGDQRLTTRGIEQAKAIGEYLVSAVNSEIIIVHQPEGRSELTARQIGKIASGTVLRSPDLQGVSLGIVGGLSEDELAERYPEVASALIAWRNHKGDLGSRPSVPGSEPMEEFAERVRAGLISSIDRCPTEGTLALVATTSTLNMLNHLLVNDGKFDRTRYGFIEFPLGAYASWLISDSPPTLTSIIKTPGFRSEDQ